MLVLNRDLNQSIIIDDEITVTVLEIHKGHVKLEIDAPRSVPVWREEIYDDMLEKEYGDGSK